MYLDVAFWILNMGQYHGAQIFYYTYVLYQKFWIEIVQTEKENMP